MFKYSLLLFVFIPVFVLAQNPPSRTEVEKMIKENKQLQEQMKKDPAFAEMMKKAMDQVEEEDKGENENNNLVTRAPKLNTAKLAAIPASILSKSELVAWSATSYNSLLNKLSVEERSRFLSALELCENDASKIEDAAILNWVNKSPEGALLFALKATMLNADEAMYWNNLAAMLNLTGNEEKAVAPLRYLLKIYPGNSIILNNLGQSYLGLGDLNKARQFLDSCLKYSPYHPEANHSMALIYRFNGNNAKANEHFEKETRVCYRKPVVEELQKHRSEDEMFEITRPKFSKPKNYFTKLGLDKFIVPDLPSSVEESNKVYQAHLDFRKNVQEEIKKWGELDISRVRDGISGEIQKSIYSQLVETVFLPHLEKQKEKDISSWMEIEDVSNVTYPTQGSIGSRSGQIRTRQYAGDLGRITEAHSYEDSVNNQKKLAELLANPANSQVIDHKWEQVRIESAIKYCREEIALADKFLMENAMNQPTGFDERVRSIIELLNEAMFYKELTPGDVSVALQANNLVQVYLTYLDAYSANTVIAGTKNNGYNGFGVQVNCDINELQAMRYELAQTKFVDASCAYKLVVPLVVAKLSFDCHAIEVEGGQILIVGVEYEFKSGNTTLALGPGAGADLPFISVGMKNQAFVTFDRNGNYSDAGFKGEAGVELSGYLTEVGEAIENMGAGPTLEAKAGYEISLNSGASAKTEIGGVETTINF